MATEPSTLKVTRNLLIVTVIIVSHIPTNLFKFPENGIIVYTDNERVIVYYQCTRVLQDGTCDPTHAHLDITVNKRSVEVFKLKWFNVLLRKLCFDPNNMQLVPHDGMSFHVTFRVTSFP